MSTYLVHYNVNNQNISKQVTTDKFYGAEGELYKSYDAVTKLAGEGARFQCVRNSMEKIQDDSKIYTIGTNNTLKPQVVNPGMTFSQLWLSWTNLFKKKYNIPNTEVTRVLTTSSSPKITTTPLPAEAKDIEV